MTIQWMSERMLQVWTWKTCSVPCRHARALRIHSKTLACAQHTACFHQSHSNPTRMNYSTEQRKRLGPCTFWPPDPAAEPSWYYVKCVNTCYPSPFPLRRTAQSINKVWNIMTWSMNMYTIYISIYIYTPVGFLNIFLNKNNNISLVLLRFVMPRDVKLLRFHRLHRRRLQRDVRRAFGRQRSTFFVRLGSSLAKVPSHSCLFRSFWAVETFWVFLSWVFQYFFSENGWTGLEIAKWQQDKSVSYWCRSLLGTHNKSTWC